MRWTSWPEPLGWAARRERSASCSVQRIGSAQARASGGPRLRWWARSLSPCWRWRGRRLRPTVSPRRSGRGDRTSTASSRTAARANVWFPSRCSTTSPRSPPVTTSRWRSTRTDASGPGATTTVVNSVTGERGGNTQMVPALTSVVAVGVAGGSQHSLMLDDAGQVWSWGSNSNGQLGDGTTIQNFVPRVVQGLPSITGLGAGQEPQPRRGRRREHLGVGRQQLGSDRGRHDRPCARPRCN